jgi:hypothetical protein
MAKKLQVFVSSTYSDLITERQAAVAAILKAGHIPAGMELFTSGDQSQLATIKAWIDESDVYMLILGGRYGSIEPESGLSYTELEFDYALAQGKPMFSVVIKEAAIERKVQAGGTGFIEKENGKALTAFRTKVLSYITAFFEDEKDVRLAVYESIADCAAKKNLVGWVPGNTVVDNTPLFEDIKKLNDENAKLRAKIAELESQTVKVANKKHEINELLDILRGTKIEIPSDIAKDGNNDYNLLDIFASLQGRFVTGIVNVGEMSITDKFLFFTAGSKLQIHGLVEYEKVAGKQYRRCIVTPMGAKLLAELEKRKIEIIRSSSKASANPTQLESPSKKTKADIPPTPITVVKKSASAEPAQIPKKSKRSGS